LTDRLGECRFDFVGLEHVAIPMRALSQPALVIGLLAGSTPASREIDLTN
jgi:hypothetical protein